MKYFAILLLSVLSSFYVVGQIPQVKETGLPLNTSIPELKATNIHGQATKLSQISGDKGAILVFYRSADWCPFCKKHLIEINKWQDKISQLGFGIAGISYDSEEVLKGFSQQNDIGFPLLADQNHQTITSFKILNQDYKPGDRHYGIPYPGIMVVNPQGQLVFKYFYQGYKNRVDMQELYDALQKMK